jgi:ergothioneine biosynthesis protein EgtB
MVPDPKAQNSLLVRLKEIRSRTEDLIKGLEPEDLCLQGMAEASPAKWHLGHTNWFFEQFLLQQLPGYEVVDSRWSYLFNSYYDSIGDRQPRPLRGLLTRPAISEILLWRKHVTTSLQNHIEKLDSKLLELGLQHEQQHQELLLIDLLDGLSRNPLSPKAFGDFRHEIDYEMSWKKNNELKSEQWISFKGGLVEIGHGTDDFHFDNEAPRHRLWLEPFTISNQLVSNDDMLAFIEDGGYHRPELWMSEGWAYVQTHNWKAPRYWKNDLEYTLAGLKKRHPKAPVRHISWFEADAYARWASARLPSEAEWELAASKDLLPYAYDCLWQWTASPYRPYPGFQIVTGALGEYNGKFMCSQFVLRGSCFLTPEGHKRVTYRNFYSPSSRWMASGIRLARDV